MNTIVKTLLIVGIIVGYSIVNSFLGISIFFSLFIMIGFLFLLFLIHIWRAWGVQTKKPKERLSVNHVRTISLQLPYDDAISLCIESLNVIKRYKIKKKDIFKGKIVARASITLWSWER